MHFQMLLPLFLLAVMPAQSPSDLPRALGDSLRLIQQQRYNQAINILGPFLEVNPDHPLALSYLGAAYLYGDRDLLKAQGLFERSFQMGGGATFWVIHSHERLGGSDITNYCRGWLHLRDGEVEFAPEDGTHAFRSPTSQIRELAQNRLSSKLFHIRDDNTNYNFRPRSGDEREIWLLVALYKKFTR